MTHIERNLQLKINEDTYNILHDTSSIERIRSMDCDSISPPDMLKVKIDSVQAINSSFEDFGSYPFDLHTFSLKLELCAIRFEGKNYLFDLYRTSLNELTFDYGVNRVPGFSLNYENSIVQYEDVNQ